MEEEIREQPNESEANAKESAIDISANKSDGSLLGKFKSVEALSDAYNNLQADYTRKCQKLSEQENHSKLYEKEEWPLVVAQFLNEHNEAKDYAKEISEELINNSKLERNENALSLAFAKVVGGKFKDPEKLINDEDFLSSYVYENEKVKEKILDSYFKNIHKSPSLISGGGARFKSEAPTACKTLVDAKKLLEEMFIKEKE